MAGKRSGGGLPQGTIRRVARRGTIWGALDARRTAEQDVREVKFVRPRGSAGAIIQNPGGGQEGYAANLLGRTLRPGTTALALSKSGEGGDNIIPGSAVGRKGAIPASPSRRPYATAPPAEPNQFAFGYDADSNLLAMLYSDGAYVSTRATTVDPGGSFTGCILSDSSALVGDGSLLLWNNGSDLKVWDVESETVYSYSVPSGWVNPTALYYYGGYLWWCEFEEIPTAAMGGPGDATFDYRLRKAATDLTGATTVTTVTSANANSYGAPFTVYDLPPSSYAFAVDVDGAVLYLGVSVSEIVNHEVVEWKGVQARFNVEGGAPSLRAWTIDEFRAGMDTTPPSAGGFRCATIGTESFAICIELSSGHAVMAKGDNASAAASDLWPTTDFDAGVSPASFNVGTGGSVLQVYGSGYLLRGVDSATVVADSIETFDGTNVPTVMYFFGV